MNSDEKNVSGGSGGGGPVDHNDMRFVDGVFERVAPKITLISGPSNKIDASFINVIAAGEGGRVMVQGSESVNIRSGDVQDPGGSIPMSVGITGVTLYAPDAAMIQIQRGVFGEPDTQFIKLYPSGKIEVNAGIDGTVTLSAGPEGTSYIQITPTGVVIKGPLVQIN
jgi:hypothetical protein